MRSPTCNQPCRKCNVAFDKLGSIPDVDVTDESTLGDIAWPVRSIQEATEVVQSAHEGKKDYEEALQK
jgi:hypothetical protein